MATKELPYCFPNNLEITYFPRFRDFVPKLLLDCLFYDVAVTNWVLGVTLRTPYDGDNMEVACIGHGGDTDVATVVSAELLDGPALDKGVDVNPLVL